MLDDEITKGITVRETNYHRFIPEDGRDRREEAKLGETGETVVIPLGMQIRHVPRPFISLGKESGLEYKIP